MQTPCGHCFDDGAMRTWMRQPDGPESCPVCREPFRPFDREAQRQVSHDLVMEYINNIAQQYNQLWNSDGESVLARFWDDLDETELQRLIRRFNRPNSTVDVSGELKTLLEASVAAYVDRLQRAVHDVVLKDVKLNLKNHVPRCYQSQLNQEATLHIAFSLTQLVPEFYAKWWKRIYLPHIYEGIEDLFLKKIAESDT